jgi:hypothetical protein
VQEVELPEVLDHLFLDAALEGEVELLKRVVGGDPGGADPQPPAGGLPGGDLGGEQRFDETLIAPFLAAGTLGELPERAGGGRGFELAEQVHERGRQAIFAAHRSASSHGPS